MLFATATGSAIDWAYLLPPTDDGEPAQRQERVEVTLAAHPGVRRAVVMARTDPDVTKHQGISFFCIDMHQPGVEVRPLRDMTGDCEFNEVFMDNARVRHDDAVGGLNNGWRAAMTMLAVTTLSISSSMGALYSVSTLRKAPLPSFRRCSSCRRFEMPRKRARTRTTGTPPCQSASRTVRTAFPTRVPWL